MSKWRESSLGIVYMDIFTHRILIQLMGTEAYCCIRVTNRSKAIFLFVMCIRREVEVWLQRNLFQKNFTLRIKFTEFDSTRITDGNEVFWELAYPFDSIQLSSETSSSVGGDLAFTTDSSNWANFSRALLLQYAIFFVISKKDGS